MLFQLHFHKVTGLNRELYVLLFLGHDLLCHLSKRWGRQSSLQRVAVLFALWVLRLIKC